MICDQCGRDNNRVYGSEPTFDGQARRRNRACKWCGYRWVTYEIAKRDAVEALTRLRRRVLRVH